MAFAVAKCPECSIQFRLLWRKRKQREKLPLATVVRLTCPDCERRFERTGAQLIYFSVGREYFPKSAEVDVDI